MTKSACRVAALNGLILTNVNVRKWVCFYMLLVRHGVSREANRSSHSQGAAIAMLRRSRTTMLQKQTDRAGLDVTIADVAPRTPQQNRSQRPNPRYYRPSTILELSSDVFEVEIVSKLGYRELCALACCCRLLAKMTVLCDGEVSRQKAELMLRDRAQSQDYLWKRHYEDTFLDGTSADATLRRAAELASCWQRLFCCRLFHVREV